MILYCSLHHCAIQCCSLIHNESFPHMHSVLLFAQEQMICAQTGQHFGHDINKTQACTLSRKMPMNNQHIHLDREPPEGEKGATWHMKAFFCQKLIWLPWWWWWWRWSSCYVARVQVGQTWTLGTKRWPLLDLTPELFCRHHHHHHHHQLMTDDGHQNQPHTCILFKKTSTSTCQ